MSENVSSYPIENMVTDDSEIYDSGELFHHLRTNNNKPKEIQPLKVSPLFEENPGFKSGKPVHENNGSTYFRQNHQIFDTVQNGDAILQNKKNLLKEKQKQTHRKEDYDVIKEYRKKIENGQVTRKGSNENSRNNTTKSSVVNTSTNVTNIVNNYNTIENLYDAADDSAVLHKKQNHGENLEVLYAKADNPATSNHLNHMNATDPDDISKLMMETGDEMIGGKSSKLEKRPRTRSNSSLEANGKLAENPNVIYASKGIEHNEVEGVQTLSHEEVMESSSYFNESANKRKSILEKKNSIHTSRQSKEKEINRHTNLNNLIFTNLTSNVKRSTLRDRSPLSNDNVNDKGNKNVHVQDDYFFIDNSGRNTVFSKQSHFTTEKNFIGQPVSSNTIKSDPGPKSKTSSTVVLPKNWSGRHVSQHGTTRRVYDFDMKVKPVQSGSGKNLTGLVFRNTNPIKDVVPASDKEAFNSLKSLDQALTNDGEVKSTDNEPVWLSHETPKPHTETFYRESKCRLTDLDLLTDTIKNTGINEGTNLRNTFYEDLSKIIDVLNVIIKTIPKEIFPFEFRPVTIQGEFEKKGQHSVDVYLTLNDFNRDNTKILFLTVKNNLKAFVTLKYLEDEGIKKFCVFNKNVNSWCLSASSLMLTFIYIINAKLRNEFESGSMNRRTDIPYNAELFFTDVSENNVKFYIKLPEHDVRYMIGLKLVIDVIDFPQVLNESRKWPPNNIKNELIRNGIHLLANLERSSSEKWTVSFLKSRKLLLGHLDVKKSATTTLLTMQLLSNKHFCNEQYATLLPAHFIMILFWIYSKHQKQEDWEQENLGKRFIDIIIALKRSLQKQECLDFFFPKLNYFQDLKKNEIISVLIKIEEFLKNPILSLQSLDSK